MNNLFVEVIEKPDAITQLSSHEIVIRVFSNDEKQQEQHRIEIVREDEQQIRIVINGLVILTHRHENGAKHSAYINDDGDAEDFSKAVPCSEFKAGERT